MIDMGDDAKIPDILHKAAKIRAGIEVTDTILPGSILSRQII
jgi:hypothetical protein